MDTDIIIQLYSYFYCPFARHWMIKGIKGMEKFGIPYTHLQIKQSSMLFDTISTMRRQKDLIKKKQCITTMCWKFSIPIEE